MSRPNARIAVPAALAAWLTLTLALAGCAGKVTSPDSASPSSGSEPSGSVSVPRSPEQAAYALAGAWSRRDAGGYVMLLAGDFDFRFPATDSAGTSYRGSSFDRFEEIAIARRLFFEGTPMLPPLQHASFTLERGLLSQPDPRPGRDARVHRVVRSRYLLLAGNGITEWRISGLATFYLTRGDSVVPPPEASAARLIPDATRWWVDRWEDEPASGEASQGAAAMPARSATLAQLKLAYR